MKLHNTKRCRVFLWNQKKVSSPESGQCLLFFAFLWERCGDRDLDLLAFWSGDGDRERLDRLGDFVLRSEKMPDQLYVCSVPPPAASLMLTLMERHSLNFGTFLQDYRSAFCLHRSFCFFLYASFLPSEHL